MNKYIIIFIIIVLIVVGGLFYRLFILPESSVPVVSGKERQITIIAKEDQWRFEPEDIIVDRGDKVIATIINEDNYDHGIAIDALGVSQRMPAKSTIVVTFVATQEGDFPFYCSVPCGEGEFEGEKRGHFDMVGKFHVRPLPRTNE